MINTIPITFQSTVCPLFSLVLITYSTDTLLVFFSTHLSLLHTLHNYNNLVSTPFPRHLHNNTFGACYSFFWFLRLSICSATPYYSGAVLPPTPIEASTRTGFNTTHYTIPSFPSILIYTVTTHQHPLPLSHHSHFVRCANHSLLPPSLLRPQLPSFRPLPSSHQTRYRFACSASRRQPRLLPTRHTITPASKSTSTFH